MARRHIAFRLPGHDWKRAVFETDYAFRGGCLRVEGKALLEFENKEALFRGSSAMLWGRSVFASLVERRGVPRIEITVDGALAVPEDHLRAPIAGSAKIHAWIALLASFFGFVASYLYLGRAESFQDPWSLKMAMHMAGWHLLLTLTLFPASFWGQRLGIRVVQGVSLGFFFIHLGIAVANMWPQGGPSDGPWIAVLNALSGLFFLAATVYGQKAHRDMNPLTALSAQ